jgi:hypothetical protein
LASRAIGVVEVKLSAPSPATWNVPIDPLPAFVVYA